MISITNTAAVEIRRLQSSRQQSDTCLYVSVKSGGCSDFLYHLELIPLEKTKTSDQHLTQSNGIEIMIDDASDSYLQGLKLDYSEDLMGGGFRFHNPQAINHCSCGQSFTMKSKT